MALSWSLVTFAFAAGAAAFFSPCSFPLVPGYLSFYLGDTAVATDGGTDAVVGQRASSVLPAASLTVPLVRGMVVGLIVSFGMLLVYGGIGGIAVVLGGRALTNIAVLEVVVGVVFVLAGGAMLTGYKPTSTTVQLPERRRTAGGFFAFGLLYAAAAAGCTAPIFVSILLRGAAAGPTAGATITLAYGAGMATVMIVLTVVTAVLGTTLVSTLSAYTDRIYQAAGVMLVLSGLVEIYYYFYGLPPGLGRVSTALQNGVDALLPGIVGTVL